MYVFMQIIARRFFQKYNQTNAMRWIQDMRHNRIYAEDGQSAAIDPMTRLDDESVIK